MSENLLCNLLLDQYGKTQTLLPASQKAYDLSAMHECLRRFFRVGKPHPLGRGQYLERLSWNHIPRRTCLWAFASSPMYYRFFLFWNIYFFGTFPSLYYHRLR